MKNGKNAPLFGLRLARRRMFEFAAAAVFAALGVNVASAAIMNMNLASNAVMLAAASVSIAGAGLSLFIGTHKASRRMRVNGMIPILDRDRACLPVRNYRLAEEVSKCLLMAFSENKALRAQWDEAPPWRAMYADDDGHLTQSDATKSSRLLKECVEYVVVELLSTHLTDHFNSEDGAKRVDTLSREHIPEVLLGNRFLALFSEAPANRAIFTGADGRPAQPDEWAHVVYSTGPGLYSRFDLTLPKGSRARRSPDGDLEIESKRMTLRVHVSLDTHTVTPFNFDEKFLGIDSSEWDDLTTLKAVIEVEITLKRRYLALGWRDYKWVDSFMKKLRNTCSFKTFLKRVRWRTIEAAEHVRDRDYTELRRAQRAYRSGIVYSASQDVQETVAKKARLRSQWKSARVAPENGKAVVQEGDPSADD